MESARGAPLRLRHLGPRARASAFRIARARSRGRRSRVLAIAYERLMQRQETDWDAAEDCLVTHGRPSALNMVTGLCGLGAMLWLYGVAWHQPMADSLGWVQRSVIASLPTRPSIIDQSIA